MILVASLVEIFLCVRICDLFSSFSDVWRKYPRVIRNVCDMAIRRESY